MHVQPSWTAKNEEAAFLFRQAERLIDQSGFLDDYKEAMNDEEIEMIQKAAKLLGQARLIESESKHVP